MNPHQKAPDKLSKIFLALAHPIRRNIISTLSNRRELSVGELAEIVQKDPQYGDISLVAVTKHMKILEKANLITRSKERQLRFSHFQAEPLKEVDEWMQKYRFFWDESFDKLDEHIEKIKQKEKNNVKSK